MKRFVTVALLLLSAAPGSARAQQQPTPQASPVKEMSEAEKRVNKILEEQKRAAEEEKKGTKEPGVPMIPDAPNLETLDEQTKAQYNGALREYYNYRISGYEHRREVFKWQLFSSKIIFVVVIFLVLVGVYFSGVQFHRAMRPRGTLVPTATGEGAKDSITTVERVETEAVTKIAISGKSIEVSSPVLGVIILVISLLFFYLYLVFVYPINEIL
jgi:hypothetical protein